MKTMCEVCGQHEAEYQCDICGRVVCQHCIDAEFICDSCREEQFDASQEHSIFGL